MFRRSVKEALVFWGGNSRAHKQHPCCYLNMLSLTNNESNWTDSYLGTPTTHNIELYRINHIDCYKDKIDA